MTATTPRARKQLNLQQYEADSQTKPCFICRVIAGEHEFHHPEIFRDDHTVAFLSRYPTLEGYLLVCPVRHVEDVVVDLSEEEYLRLQRHVHRIGRAVSKALPTERLYVATLGSKQGNAHVHWHVAPLPPGVPQDRQQFRALMVETDGYLVYEPDELEALAVAIAAAIS